MLLDNLKIAATIIVQLSSILTKSSEKKPKPAKQHFRSLYRSDRDYDRTSATFYIAEEEHQEYYKKNPENFARNHARRAAFLEDHWEQEHA